MTGHIWLLPVKGNESSLPPFGRNGGFVRDVTKQLLFSSLLKSKIQI